jgi:hypothetical protein
MATVAGSGAGCALGIATVAGSVGVELSGVLFVELSSFESGTGHPSVWGN